MNDRKIYLDEVKSTLLSRKAQIEEILKNLSQEKEDDQVRDLGDQALSAINESIRSSYQNTEHEEYSMILKALRAIEDGTYGLCMDCNQPISEKRLKHYPNASRCLACQETLESSPI